MAGSLPHVRQGQRDVRRCHQGHAVLEGRRRHDALHGPEQPDRERYLRARRDDGLPEIRRRLLRRQARRPLRRLPREAPEDHPQRRAAAPRDAARPDRPGEGHAGHEGPAHAGDGRGALELLHLPEGLQGLHPALPSVRRPFHPRHADVLLRHEAGRGELAAHRRQDGPHPHELHHAAVG